MSTLSSIANPPVSTPPPSPSPDETTPVSPPRDGSRAGMDVAAAIPTLPVERGAAQIVSEGKGKTEFRYILDRFEGIDQKRHSTEIGELQATVAQNLITDEFTLRKIAGSEDVSGSGSTTQVGLHSVSGASSLQLQNCDDSTEWTETDAVNFARSTETTIKQEGTASLKMVTTGVGADGATITHDLGAGVDLRSFDSLALFLRGQIGSRTTSVLRPNGAGTTTQWSPSAGANWENVDDVTADGDATRNSASLNGKTDLYALSNLVGTAITPTSVRVIATVKPMIAVTGDPELFGTPIRIRIRTLGTEFNAPFSFGVAGEEGYTEIGHTWTTNPQTELAWTVAAINALEAGVTLVRTASYTSYITQLRVEVTHFESTSDKLFFGVSADNTTYYELEFVDASDTWGSHTLALVEIPEIERMAIRYLRFRYDVIGGAPDPRTLYADDIRVTGWNSYLLRALHVGGADPTGGPRRGTGTMSVDLESNASGTWVSLGNLNPLENCMKVRAVDWLGETYIAAGAMMRKLSNGEIVDWSEAPPGALIEMHYEKLWIWRLPQEPNALRHSDTNSSTSWPTVAAPTGGNGGTMYVGRNYAYFPTGIKSAFGNLFLWTEGDLWILFGTDNTNFNLQRAHPGAGTLSHESIARFDTGAIWHDGLQNRILMWRAGEVYDIGDPIRPTIEAIPALRKPWTAGSFDGRFYIFSYSRADLTQNDRCYLFDTALMRWHGPYTGSWVGFNAATRGADGSKYAGSSNDNGVRKILVGETDNGAAIPIDWTSGDFHVRMPRWHKRARRFWITCASTTATLTLELFRDMEATPIYTNTLAFTGAAVETRSVGLSNTVRGDFLRIRLTESSVNPVNILRMGIDGGIVRALR